MATNNNNMLTIPQLAVDMVATYNYRTTDYGFIAGNSAGSVHIIWGIVSPVGLLAGVPNGSIFFDVITKIGYIKQKTGAPAGVGSGVDGTWTAMSGS